MSEQHGRKRSASCREESQSSSAWEPASKRLRSLVHQMRSLSLGDLPWSRRKVALDVRPLNPPPTPDATPLPERRRLGAGGTAPSPAAVSAAAAAAAALAAAAAVAAAAPEPRCRSNTIVNHSCSLSVPSAGFSDAYCDAYSSDPYSSEASEHGAKRSEDEPAGGRAKKARNRMRLGQNGVVMTSCYIEQTLYT